VHGALESPEVVMAITGTRPSLTLDTTFNELAELIEDHMDIASLDRLVRH